MFILCFLQEDGWKKGQQQGGSGVLAGHGGVQLQSWDANFTFFGWWSPAGWGGLYVFMFTLSWKSPTLCCRMASGENIISLAFFSFCAVYPSNPLTSSHLFPPRSFFPFSISNFFWFHVYYPSLLFKKLLLLFTLCFHPPLFATLCYYFAPLLFRLLIPTGRGYSPLTWPLRP